MKTSLINKASRRLILALAFVGFATFLFVGNKPQTTPAEGKALPLNADHRGLISENQLPLAEKAGTGVQPLTAGSPDRQTAAAAALDELSNTEQQSLWTAFSEARREVRPIPEHWAEREENQGYDFYALHPKQHLTTRFGAQGVQIVSSDRTYTEADAQQAGTAWQANMRLLTFAGQEVPTGALPEKSDELSSRVEYCHQPDITEWFDNGVEGMEHGYTIAARPAHLSDGEPVSLTVAVDGLTVAQQTSDDDTSSVLFMDGDRDVLSYSKLLVVDALGNQLPATMEATDSGVLLAYNDTHAVYPVTVDPLIGNEAAKLGRAAIVETEAGDQFGISVAISGDTAIVGADGDDDGGVDSGCAYVLTRDADSWTVQAKLIASDATAGDQFGSSVAISGETVVVGAPLNSENGAESGSAYVFTRSGTTWSQQAKLPASDVAAGDHFGCSVAISGDTVVVGSYLDYTDAGSVYVFVRSGSSWTQQTKLGKNISSGDDYFGTSVAISGETMVVGAPGDDDGGTNSGRVYLFSRSDTTWTQLAELTASDAAAGDEFGGSVAISGTTIVIGASGNGDAGADTGSAYVFYRARIGSWRQQAKLTASDAEAGDQFGTSVAISDDSIVVGARYDDESGENSGSAYVFTRVVSTWSQLAKLIATDAAADDGFGGSVAISDDSVVVGAMESDSFGADSGSATIFTRANSTWSQQVNLTQTNVAPGDYFGSSVAISGDSVVIGASGDDDGGSSSGSAYVFTFTNSIWSQQAKLVADDAESWDFFGRSVSISDDSVVIGADGDDNGGSAYVFTRNGSSWSQQDRLIASDATDYSRFGYAVAISGDSVVIGAHGNDDDLGGLIDLAASAAYVFIRSGSAWYEQAKLIADGVEASDYFGHSVAISGDSVVIGAKLGDGDGGETESGAAYVFTRTNSIWSQQAKLNAVDAAASDFFGYSVAISGDSIVIGALGDNDGGGSSGSAYVFTRSGSSWPQQAKLTASDAAASDYFGKSVAISGDSVVIGAYGDDDGGDGSGSAYVFTRSGSSWPQQAKLTASDAAAGDYYGISVAISGNSVVIGTDGDGSVSGAYIYRLTSPPTTLTVFDSLGEKVLNNSAARSFAAQLETYEDYTFRLQNTSEGDAGELALDIQSVSLGGPESSQFSLTVPDISSTADLASGESLYLTITFNPTGGSGLRDNATVSITSNDPNQPIYSFSLSGFALSGAADADSDGMTDWAEYALREHGFVWDETQSSKVENFYEMASAAGLYTQDEAAAVEGSASIVDVDPETQTAGIVIELDESLDLETFEPIPIDPANLSVDGDGNIRVEVDAPDGKKFFRAQFK